MRGQTLPLIVLVVVALAAVFFVVETQQEMPSSGHGTHSPLSGLASGGGKTISVIAYTDGSCVSTADCDQPGTGVTPPASSFASVLGPSPIVCVAPTCPAPPCHDSVFMSPSAHCCTPKQRPCRTLSECTAEHASSSLGINPFACSVYFPPFAPTSFIGTVGGLFHPPDSGGFGCCTFCGDGVLDAEGIDDLPGTADDEECDDNNQVSGDGCSSSCKIEEVILSGVPTISIVKKPSFNFTQYRKIVIWAIILNVTSNGTNATNVSLNDTLTNATFLNSSPSSLNGTNISLGNLSNGTIFIVNVTAEVNCTVNLTNTTVFWLHEEEDFVSTGDKVGLGWFTQDDAFVSNSTSLTVNTTCFVAGRKDDSPDPLNVSMSNVLNYTITVNVSGDFNFTNVTVVDAYASEIAAFVSSDPAPDGGTNNTWSLGNLSNGTVFVINISVNVSSQANGTIINNTANITWRDENGILYIFPVSEQTTLIAPVDTNVTVVKGAPANVFAGGTLVYTITITASNEDAFNVTVNDTLPQNVTFVSSILANTSNATWDIGNITAGTSSVVLITVQVNESLPVGWLLNNSVNVTFNNVTGGNRSASAVAQTTVILPSSGQGGGSPGIGRYVPFEEEPQVQAPAPSISTMTSDALTSVSVQNWVPPEISFEEGSIACGYVTSGGKVVPSRAKSDVPVPPGFELISQPVQFSCAGDSLDFTLSVPDNFEEIRVLRCKGGSCADMPREVFTEELICNGQSLHQLRRDEVISRSKGLEAARSFTSESKELSERDRWIVGGSIRLTLTGELPVPVSVQIARAPNVLRPENKALSPMGTPHEVRVSGPNIRLPALLEWSFIVPPGYDVSNFAAYAVKGTEWVYLGASYDAETELLKVVIDDVNALLEGGKTTFVLVGLADPMSWVENKPKFVRAYDGKGARDAIVLVHGFGSSATWQPFVDDFQLTGQPYQVWLFSYPASQPNEENAKALASFLELHSAEYDNVYIVAHSLGTLVTQRALDSARSDGLPVLGKVRKAVLIAGPGQGTPTVQVFRELFTRFLSERGALGMLNMHPQVYADLAEGVTVQPVSGVGYSVIAGNAGYWFTERLFGGVPNDGVVSVTSAKKVGDSYVDDPCKDFFEVSAGHIDLNDHPIGRRIVQQLITGSRAAQNPDAALPGFNQFVRVEMQDCSADDRVFVIGRRIAENAVLDPTGCSCGNGVCGLGETQESCPGDCVREVVRSTGCLLVPVPMFLGVVLLVLLAGALLVIKHVLNRPVPAWLWAAVLGLAVLSVLLQAYQASSCLPKFPAAYLALASVLILLGIDYVVGKMPQGPKGPLGINDELADVKKAIEELKRN